MKKPFLIYLALTLSFTGMNRSLFAEDKIIQQVWNDGKYIAVSPTRLDAADLPWFLGAAALMGGAFAADWDVHHDLKTKVHTGSAKDFRNFGDNTQWIAPLIAVGSWATGECKSKDYLAETGRMAVSGLLWTAFIEIT